LIEFLKDLINKHYKHNLSRKREIARIPRRRARVKHHGLTMKRLNLMTNLNLLKEEGLAKVTTKRRTLIKVRCNAIIVRSMDILLMSVGTRRIKRMKKKQMLLRDRSKCSANDGYHM
jgi:threonine synthase